MPSTRFKEIFRTANHEWTPINTNENQRENGAAVAANDLGRSEFQTKDHTDGTDVVGAIDPNRPGAVQVYRPYRYTGQCAEDAEDQTGFTE
jgi:hypothetical protein